MPKKTRRRLKVISLKRTSPGERLAKISVIASTILILLGAIGLILIQKPLRKSQDIRQQASIADGLVTVSASPASGTILETNKEATFTLSVNTNGVQTDGVQLVFNMITPFVAGAPTVEVISGSGLQPTFQEIEQTADGFLISVLALPQTIGQPFSTSTDTPFLRIKVTPTQPTGPITLNFDVEKSISTVHKSDPVKDELKHISSYTYDVVEQISQATSPSPSPQLESSPTPSPSSTPAQQASPSPSPSPSAAASPSPSTSPVVSPSPQASPSPAASPTPGSSPEVSPSPSADANGSNIGGTSLATCNQSCSSNNDCAANLRCYNGQCRLATNVSSTSCVNPPDQGLTRVCNEYCADSRECGYGLSCYFNRCRNPLNLDSTSCQAPTKQVVQAISSDCNQSCRSHRDCAANLLCYGPTKTCRLAINPSSLSCSPTSKKTVSPLYSAGKSGSSKGGPSTSLGSAASATAGASLNASDSGIAIGQVKPSPQAEDFDSASPLPSSQQEIAQTPFDVLRNFLETRLPLGNALGNLPLPMLLLGGGVGLLAIAAVVFIISRMAQGGSAASLTKPAGSPPASPPSSTLTTKPPLPRSATLSPSQTPATNPYEKQLQQKIDTLKKQAPPASQPARPQPPTVQAPAPRPPRSQPASGPRSPQLGQPPRQKPRPQVGRPTPPAAGKPNPAMIDRLKSKGVQTP